MRWKITYIILLISLIVGQTLHAQTATSTDEIQAKIDERTVQIKQLEKEINQYNTEVIKAGNQAKTLQSTIKTLDLTKKKITTDINLTEKKISKANLTIGKLGTEIDKTKYHIDVNKKAVISSLQKMQLLEDMGLFQLFLSKKDIGEVWSDIDTAREINRAVREKSNELETLQMEMETNQSNLTGQKKSLVTLKQDLSGKKQAVELTAKEKATILAETKNKEATFQAILKTKQQQRDEFEKEVSDFEAQLNFSIDKSSYPSAKNDILSWPLDIPPTKYVCDQDRKILVSCIVQKFRRPKTLSANDKGHNGTDFRANTGTSINTVLAGTVAGTGDTGLYKGCVGFGRWVMVNHDNGLSTIYMHLSVISVSKGQRLETGNLIGFSGNTGNSEAPHLHMSLYATQGVQIQLFTSSTGCKQAAVPLADPKAYLDPLSYFPRIN